MVASWPWVEDSHSIQYKDEEGSCGSRDLLPSNASSNARRQDTPLTDVVALRCRSCLRRNRARLVLHVRHGRRLLPCLTLIVSGLLLTFLLRTAGHTAHLSLQYRDTWTTPDLQGVKGRDYHDENSDVPLFEDLGDKKTLPVDDKLETEHSKDSREQKSDEGSRFVETLADDTGHSSVRETNRVEVFASNDDGAREYYEDKPSVDAARRRSEQFEYDRRVLEHLHTLHVGGEVVAGDGGSDGGADYLMPPCDGPDLADVRPNPRYGFVVRTRLMRQSVCRRERGGWLRRVQKARDGEEKESGKSDISYFLKNFENASSVIYRTLEKGSNFHRLIVGDGSPSYFFDNRHWPLIPGNERCTEPRVTVASHIHHLYPKAKIILILRNPVDRLYSSYLYNHAKVGAVSSIAFDEYVRDAINIYTDCFSQHSLRYCANNATVFRRAKIVKTRHKQNLSVAMHLISDFTFHLRELEEEEISQIVHDDVFNKGQHYSKGGPILSRTRLLLQAFFRPYNEQLASMMNDPDLLWL
ncbi:hypothetical protein C0Q70_05545 [Pomacea canaliculata]|uniref:Sulfotransferase domain-containing protein n=1 Tax=Pomacea canaliculata TaxID=400727 RepID=A0A2T7PLH1_POMCA|nr:hypothetical protein C0Q70_05545 [Pomacea canaliculata]